MIKLFFLTIILVFFLSCEKINDSGQNNKTQKKINYTTKYCLKNKKLWAKSFIGKKAPDFTVEGWVGQKPSLKNKFILIDFWGTHCPQCKKAIPELNKIHKKYKDKIVVIGIAGESEKMIKSMKYPIINYYSAYDTRNKLKNKFKVRGIPHIVIIAPDKTVVWEGYPFLPQDRLTVEKVGKIINN